jgi:hypothetical protein
MYTEHHSISDSTCPLLSATDVDCKECLSIIICH